jgi:hypothetical protein
MSNMEKKVSKVTALLLITLFLFLVLHVWFSYVEFRNYRSGASVEPFLTAVVFVFLYLASIVLVVRKVVWGVILA